MPSYSRRSALVTAAHILLATLSLTSLPGHAQTVLTLGVVPQFNAVDIAKQWMPLIHALNERAGVSVQLKTYPSIPDFEKAFLDGGMDLTFLNPYHMVMAKKAQGYVPLVHRDDALEGVLVTRADKPYTGLAQFHQQPVAFPSPNAFGASLYMRALLSNEGVNVLPNYVKTHSNAYRQVLAGNAAAAGGIQATFDKEPKDIRDQLKIVYRTPETAPHPIAAHPRVPAELQKKLTTALMGLAKGPDAEALFQPTSLYPLVTAHYDKEYRPLEKLGLERFVVLETPAK